jgi:tetratricopeptide (TPR) repeat protein
MLRRTLTFVAAIALIGAVATMVYFNSQPTTLRYGPTQEITLPLAWLIVFATVAGLLLGLLALVAREGRWAVRQWRVQRALRASERAVARRSEARSCTLAGRHAHARALISRTATGPGAVLDDAIDYGESFLAEEKPAEARAHLEEARREIGDDPRLLHALARSCRALGDHVAAVAVLDRAIEALPTSLALHSLLRDSLVELQWWPRAEVAQQRIVDLDPGDPDEKTRLIEIRMHAAEEADTADREAALRAVLALDPSWPAAATARAAQLIEQGRTRSAVRVLYKAARRRPADETLSALDSSLEIDNPKKLARLYGRLRRSHPASHEVALHHAALLDKLGRTSEAAAIREELGAATEAVAS